ncbi:MAG: hypothetical protein QM621_11945 [Aeromicrobium sp.]|uniref:hypothetical protein n=1 Tax=Aeromicrobium sp. TaxID=1871063 RepID=UPI0039E56518
MSWLEPVLVIGTILVVGFGATWMFQRSLDQPGGRDGLGTGGNGMGMVENVFSPTRGDAREELERQKKVGAVLPSTDDSPPETNAEFDADGTLRSVTFHRPTDA